MVTLMVIKKGTFSKCLEVLFRSSEWVFSTFTNFSAVHTSVSACENSRGTHVHVNIGLTYNTMSSARHSVHMTDMSAVTAQKTRTHHTTAGHSHSTAIDSYGLARNACISLCCWDGFWPWRLPWKIWEMELPSASLVTATRSLYVRLAITACSSALLAETSSRANNSRIWFD